MRSPDGPGPTLLETGAAVPPSLIAEVARSLNYNSLYRINRQGIRPRIGNYVIVGNGSAE